MSEEGEYIGYDKNTGKILFTYQMIDAKTNKIMIISEDRLRTLFADMENINDIDFIVGDIKSIRDQRITVNPKTKELVFTEVKPKGK